MSTIKLQQNPRKYMHVGGIINVWWFPKMSKAMVCLLSIPYCSLFVVSSEVKTNKQVKDRSNDKYQWQWHWWTRVVIVVRIVVLLFFLSSSISAGDFVIFVNSTNFIPVLMLKPSSSICYVHQSRISWGRGVFLCPTSSSSNYRDQKDRIYV